MPSPLPGAWETSAISYGLATRKCVRSQKSKLLIFGFEQSISGVSRHHPPSLAQVFSSFDTQH